MKKFFPTMIVVLTAIASYSQELSQVTFSAGSTLSSFSFITDQKVVIRISENGSILEWGMDPGTGRYNYYTGKLQPYMGRVDYYSQSDFDSVIRGKVKSIGTTTFTYYGASETSAKIGKVKSIGSVALDYFTNFDNKDNQGKLKSANYTSLDYYSSFENEAIRGKLKSVGNSAITYYSSFDDKQIQGKIKSIGSFTYTWYTSHDKWTGLKSGQYFQNVNGITYIVR